MRFARLLLVLLPVACGRAPATAETAPKVHTAAAPAEPPAAAESAPPVAAEARSPSTPDAAVAKFLDSANSDDDGGARATSTADCWEKECQSFASQAGRKFQARVVGETRQGGDHAVVGVDVVCPGERKCDFVHLLFALSNGEWRVSDVTEDDAKAKAWVP